MRKTAKGSSGLFDEIVVDLFAGGGGASLGIERAIGRAVDVAVNHDPESIAMHQANHPHTMHLCSDVFEVDPIEATGGRPVGILWASPDCRHFSKAKGGRPVSKKIRGLAWVVVRWAAAVKPRIIFLENVEEFQTWGPLGPDGRPCPKRKGQTFRSWTGQLRKLGYDVQWRELRACDYGAPTTRKRLFLVARRDGEPIRWPKPTHGKGSKPYHTAAECIDWSIPCPSIFDRKRPLADNTLRRIAAGLKRFVIDNPRPFLVNLTHGGRVEDLDQPLRTVTGANRGEKALCAPYLSKFYGTCQHGSHIDKPCPTCTAGAGGGHQALVAAFLAKHYGGVVGQSLEQPIGTVTAIDHHSIVAPILTKYHGQKGNESRCLSPETPINTLDTQNRFGVVAPYLVGIDHQSSHSVWPADAPLTTITRENRHALVSAFFVHYYGQGESTGADQPMYTITSRDRFGLVTVTIDGQPYAIIDIGLRMLAPRELALAQGFPDDYLLTGSKSNQVARIGNSVCPDVAAEVVRANMHLRRAEEAIATTANLF